jgi:hypothetical protein
MFVVEMIEHAAVPVVGVLAEADVGDDEQVGHGRVYRLRIAC